MEMACWPARGVETPGAAGAPSIFWRVSVKRAGYPAAVLHTISPYFDPTHTRTGWIGQPPILDFTRETGLRW